MENVDILVITALAEEYDAFRDLNSDAWEDNWEECVDLGGYRYETRPLRCEAGPARVALARADKGGKVVAKATLLIQQLAPRCVAMCGICAGWKKKVKLGDVVFADRVFDFSSGKDYGNYTKRVIDAYRPDPRWREFAIDASRRWRPPFVEERPLSYESQENWYLYVLLREEARKIRNRVDRRTRCPDWATVIERLQHGGLVQREDPMALTDEGEKRISNLEYRSDDDIESVDDLPEDEAFKLHVGPVATVNMVQENAAVFELISNHEKDVVALEMEGYLLGQLAEMGRVKYLAVAKGVSDYGDPDKGDRYRRFAAKASAAFLLHMLEKRYTPRADRLGDKEKKGRLFNVSERNLKNQLGRRGIEKGRKEAGQDLRKGGFFQKYIAPIYEERGDSKRKFLEFILQDRQRCYLVTGKAGKGKTSLLCRLAEALAQPTYVDEMLPILIDSALINFDAVEGQDEVAVLGSHIAAAVHDDEHQPEFEDLCGLLQREKVTAVVFLDAVNELRGAQPFTRFNDAFEALLKWVDRNDYPLLFCLSCRTDFLSKFRSDSWPVFSRLNGDPTKPTYELVDFEQSQIQTISKKYFEWYGIDVELVGSALESCRDPLMLRYFCMAYTKRPIYDKRDSPFDEEIVELPLMSNLRRKQVFDKFVENRRDAIVEKSVPIICSHLGKPKDELTVTDRYRYTSFYLLHIANRMFEEKEASLTASDVLDVAEMLDHSDASLGNERMSRRDRERLLIEHENSIFFRFLEEGIILEPQDRQGSGGRPSGVPTERRYQFVFETYFEYTLGRFFAQVRWPKQVADGGGDGGAMNDPVLDLGSIDRKAIIADFKRLLDMHGKLVNFTNIFGALQLAVLIVEDSEIYREMPDLFLEMLRLMSCGDDKQRLDWAQQACSTIRETYTAQSPAEVGTDDPPPDRDAGMDPTAKRRITREEVDRALQAILKLLEDLAKSSDFVIMWDVRNTLVDLGRNHKGPVVRLMESWIFERTSGLLFERTNNLLPMFAMESLAHLSYVAPQESLDLIALAGDSPLVTTDFWMARSWVNAVTNILQRRHEPSTAQFGISQSQWDRILGLLKRLVEQTERPFMRGVALPAMALERDDREMVPWMKERVSSESDRWVLWNLAFELRHWPWDIDRRPEIWDYLEMLAEVQDPHVGYAVDSTAQYLEDKFDSFEAKKIRATVGGKESNEWLAFPVAGGPPRRLRWGADPRSAGIVYTPAYFEPSYDNHIECRQRLQAMMGELLRFDNAPINWIHPDYVQERYLKQVHGKDIDGEDVDRHRDQTPWPSYVDDVRRAGKVLREQEGRTIQSGPSELRYESYEAALLSAGGAVCAVEYVLGNPEAQVAWSMGRPPGHLANNHICIFNNIAIAAVYAKESLKRDLGRDARILIVDCDAHHGKHTDRVFEKDPTVVYFSMHVHGVYSIEHGNFDNIGTGPGAGYNFNLPYPKRMGDAGYMFIVDDLLVPLAEEFEPDLILFSAGFDGHFEDPLTPDCCLTENAFIYLAKQMKRVGGSNQNGTTKFAGVVEGGYGLESCAKCLVHMLNVLGDWGLSEREIGFVDSTKYEEFLAESETERIMVEVRKLVRRRIELIFKVQRESSGYAFRSDKWRTIYSELAGAL